MDADIQREYSRQRKHLEQSVASLRKKLTKDTEIHRADNVRIMQVRFLLHLPLLLLYGKVCGNTMDALIVFWRKLSPEDDQSILIKASS